MKASRILTAMAACLALATAGAGARGAEEYWPAESWRTSTPEAQGLSSAELAKLFDAVAQEQINIHSLLLIRNGYLCLEAYFYPYQREELHDICSCTKSVSSTLVGIALEQGKIRSVKEDLGELFPGRQLRNDTAQKQRITLEHILTMSSGMDYPLLGEPRLAPMRAAPDMVQHILDLPMAAEPGTTFGYNSGGSHLLSALITIHTGQSAEQFASQYLFGPLGIRRYTWPADAQGNSFGWGDLRLTSPDMARFGYLFLKKGQWEGKQIVSRRWVKEATRSHIDTGDEAGYGYQWWVREDPFRFEALGRAGQRITVLPQLATVLVETGGGYEPDDVGKFIAAAVRSDRPLPEDPPGYSLLQAKIAVAARAPDAQPVPALPPLAREISGKQYALAQNPLGLRAIGFAFEGGDTAGLELELADGRQSLPVGLDGVYRVTQPAAEASPVAIRGEWLAEKEFGFVYNEFLGAHYMSVRAVFQAEGLTLSLKDPWDDLDLTIEGQLK